MKKQKKQTTVIYHNPEEIKPEKLVKQHAEKAKQVSKQLQERQEEMLQEFRQHLEMVVDLFAHRLAEISINYVTQLEKMSNKIEDHQKSIETHFQLIESCLTQDGVISLHSYEDLVATVEKNHQDLMQRVLGFVTLANKNFENQLLYIEQRIEKFEKRVERACP